MPAAALWDLDGTIVDTEPLWIAAEYDLAERHDAPWTIEDAMHVVGSDLIDSGRYIRERMGLDLTPHEIVDDLIAGVLRQLDGDIAWRPGALELLGRLRDAGVPLALVTMSWRSIVDALLPHLPDGIFDIVVTGDEVEPGKPHPEPYLAAARALGVDPSSCIAFEDSPTGAKSAEAAGCHVVVVAHHVPVPGSGRRTLVESLVDLDFSRIDS